MKRSELKRTKPLRTPAPATARVKLRKCAICRAQFLPRFGFESWCSPPHGLEVHERAEAKKAAKAQREEKAKYRATRERLKTIGQIEEECRKIVQAIARIRDRADGCISCHMGPNYKGQWHGSHYRAHGGCSSLQMHLWNIHKSCAQCNLFKSGNKEGFITGLLAKPGYGRERLEWLDSQPKSKRFSRDYLARFKAVMGKRLKRMEKWQ